MTRGLYPAPENLCDLDPWEDPAVAGEFQSRARQEGTEFDAIALDYLVQAGSTVIAGRHSRCGYPVDAEIEAANGLRFLVLAHGNVGEGSAQPGLSRTDTLAKVGFRALMLHAKSAPPVIVVTSHLPQPNSVGARQLADLHAELGNYLADVVATTGDFAGFQRLRWLLCSTTTAPLERRRAPWWNPGHDLTLFDFLSEDSDA
jgi:hypothetical protein